MTHPRPIEPLEPRTLLSGYLENLDTPNDLTAANGLLLFTNDDGVHGPELWRSDGTPAGTYLLKDIRRGPEGGRPAADYDFLGTRKLVTLGTYTYFVAADRGFNEELWRTDGTPAGTTIVRDLYPGRYGSSPADMVVFKNQLFLVASYTPTPGVPLAANHLWATDGTAAGFVQISRGTYDVRGLTVVGNYLFFVNTDENGQSEIWRTDGTTKGTQRLNLSLGVTGDDNPYSSKLTLRAAAGRLFVFDAFNGALWRVDPSTSALTRVAAGAFTPVGVMNNRLLYTSLTSSGTYEPDTVHLWSTDGTTAGTREIWQGDRESATNVGNGGIDNRFTIVGNTLFFNGNARFYQNIELWASDGTAAGTRAVKTSGFSSYGALSNFAGVAPAAWFVDGTTLWKSDGTTAGTTAVADVPDDASASPNDVRATHLTATPDGRLFFVGYDPARDYALYTFKPGVDKRPVRLRTSAPVGTLAKHLLTINGTRGDDTIVITARKGTLSVAWNGEPAETYALADVSALLVNAGTGNDTITLAGPVPAPTVSGGDGDDTLTAGDTPALLQGDDGADLLTGGPADDRLYGGDFRDTLFGNAGNDDCYGDDPENAQDGGDWEDTLNGGPGSDVLSGGDSPLDTADYSDRGENLVVTLDGRARDGAPGERDNVLPDVEDIIGGWGSDHFVGTAADNILLGYRGNDTLDGGDGSDNLDGGRGDDQLFGRDGDDILDGGLGADTLDAGDGDDRIRAADPVPTRDRVFAGPGDDTVEHDSRDRVFDAEDAFLA